MNQMIQKAGKTIEKNSPVILTVVGVAGVVTTVAFAIKATPKATKLKNEAYKAKMEKGEDFTIVDTVKATWKVYIPTMIAGTATIASIIGSNQISSRRIAAVTTAYTLSESAFHAYKDKVIEQIGEKKEKKVRDEVAKEHLARNPVKDKEVIITGRGETLCYDVISGRYFKSDMNTLQKIANDLNRRIMSEMYISLNELYSELGLSPIKIGDDMGWNTDGDIEFDFSSQLADDGTPCLVLDYCIGPRYDFRSLM